jgi:hypothetical protein
MASQPQTVIAKATVGPSFPRTAAVASLQSACTQHAARSTQHAARSTSEGCGVFNATAVSAAQGGVVAGGAAAVQASIPQACFCWAEGDQLALCIRRAAQHLWDPVTTRLLVDVNRQTAEPVWRAAQAVMPRARQMKASSVWRLASGAGLQHPRRRAHGRRQLRADLCCAVLCCAPCSALPCPALAGAAPSS